MRPCTTTKEYSLWLPDQPHTFWTHCARVPCVRRTRRARQVSSVCTCVPVQSQATASMMDAALELQARTLCTAPSANTFEQTSRAERELAPAQALTITAKVISSIDQAGAKLAGRARPCSGVGVDARLTQTHSAGQSRGLGCLRDAKRSRRNQPLCLAQLLAGPGGQRLCGAPHGPRRALVSGALHSWAIAHVSGISELQLAPQVKEEGWLPQHILLQDSLGTLLACCPLYLKGHSQGEYVFDHAWAQAAYQMGVRYYPKLQSCSPFSPVTGARLLVRSSANAPALAAALARTLVQVAGEAPGRARFAPASEAGSPRCQACALTGTRARGQTSTRCRRCT